MPTYDYECDACGHTFEQFQSIKAPAVRRCPVCRKLKVRRLIGTGGGVIFKGSGFYATDYRSDSYTKSAKADTDGANGSDGDGKSKDTASSSDSKSADSSAKSKESTSTGSKNN